RTAHVTPLLIQLHWLPVPYQIDFKTILLTFKSLHSLAPTYLTDLLQTYTPYCSLRSSSAGLPSVRDFNLTMGGRAFSHTAPRLWNSLPLRIHQLDCYTIQNRCQNATKCY
ncbi:hypothetical protein LDENG_00058620, partial [Lucifuga dentata]